MPKTKINDVIIRTKLIESLEKQKGSSCIIEEFSVARGKARADVVYIDSNAIHAYEIKSDVDNLLRLPNQAAYYSSVFSTVTLVVGMEHAVKAMYLIPNWWGVIIAQPTHNGIILNSIREAQMNENMKYDSVSDILSKEEFITVLGEHAPGKNYWKMSKPRLVDEARALIEEDLIINDFPRIVFSRSQHALTSA